MLIGELSRKTGFSRDTIRYYEKQGLFSVGRKERRDNNYKEYSDDVLEKLLSIKRMKGFGFTLNEISELLEMMELNNATCENVSAMMNSKVEVIDAKIRQMIELRNMLISSSSNCITCCSPEDPGDNCPMLTTDKIH